MKDFFYNTTQSILEYNDNTQYRICIRNLFNIDKNIIMKELEIKHANFSTFDDETIDELCIDMSCVEKDMNKLYELTKDNKMFQELYELAAARMFSTDPTIGQVILFSYDFLYLFHPCLCVYLEHPEFFNEQFIYFKQLKKVLTNK